MTLRLLREVFADPGGSDQGMPLAVTTRTAARPLSDRACDVARAGAGHHDGRGGQGAMGAVQPVARPGPAGPTDRKRFEGLAHVAGEVLSPAVGQRRLVSGLLQYARLGLVEAIDGFDPRREASFETPIRAIASAAPCSTGWRAKSGNRRAANLLGARISRRRVEQLNPLLKIEDAERELDELTRMLEGSRAATSPSARTNVALPTPYPSPPTATELAPLREAVQRLPDRERRRSVAVTISATGSSGCIARGASRNARAGLATPCSVPWGVFASSSTWHSSGLLTVPGGRALP